MSLGLGTGRVGENSPVIRVFLGKFERCGFGWGTDVRGWLMVLVVTEVARLAATRVMVVMALGCKGCQGRAHCALDLVLRRGVCF